MDRTLGGGHRLALTLSTILRIVELAGDIKKGGSNSAPRLQKLKPVCARYTGAISVGAIVAAVGVPAVFFLHKIKTIFVASTHQQLVQMIMNGRWFLIDHPELVERDFKDEKFQKFTSDKGGVIQYLLRRNVITSLELLFFQRKYKVFDKEFFESQCDHIWPWFYNPEFLEVWKCTKSLHTKEFQEFVDSYLIQEKNKKGLTWGPSV